MARLFFFSNKVPGFPLAGAVFAGSAAVFAILGRDNLFNSASSTPYSCVFLLVLAIQYSINSPWYTTMKLDETGITVLRGRGRGRHVSWTDVVDIEKRTDKRWTDGGRPYLKVDHLLTLRLRDGKPLVLRNMEPRDKLEVLLDVWTRHLPSPRLVVPRTVVLDGTTEFDGAQARGSTITTLVVIVVLCTLSGHYARVEASDPIWWWWVITFMPAWLLAPLAVLLAWGEFGQPAYSLSSSGNTFTVVRRRYGREETATGEWSRISETRYQIEKSPRQRDFCVDAGPNRLVFHSGEYPPLIAWFNARAPLDYEWIPVKSIGGRHVLDKIGDYARVPRDWTVT